jgi:hypothetical protein
MTGIRFSHCECSSRVAILRLLGDLVVALLAEMRGETCAPSGRFWNEATCFGVW